MSKLPGWYKGQMRNCQICGWWYGEDEGKFRSQRGLDYICPDCYESLTDQERQENIQRMMR